MQQLYRILERVKAYIFIVQISPYFHRVIDQYTYIIYLYIHINFSFTPGHRDVKIHLESHLDLITGCTFLFNVNTGISFYT